MSAPVKLIRRLTFLALAMLIAGGIIAPFIQVNRLAGRIKVALQNSLHRRVDIGDVHLNLFTGPGFSVDHVLIYEDPSIGLEPFAYVLSLEARVRLSSLWTGRLEFSTLTLEDPSVNLVKPENAQWNIIPLLQQTNASAGVSHLPVIQVRSGRLNFKFGDTKSSFYLTNANIDISPQWGAPGSFDVRFSGSPARTDRAAQGFGALNGRGRWITSSDRESRFDLNLELEKSDIDEMARLLRGRTLGLHGLIASKASIKGPLSNLEVTGQFQIEDIHRWDLIPQARTGGVRVNYRGAIDWRAQKIEITAGRPDNPNIPVALRMRVFDYLTKPRWAADVTFDQLPAAPLVEVARHMGMSLPKEFGMEGKINGVVGYASVGGMQGQAALMDATIQTGGARLDVKRAGISLDGDHIRLDPADVTGESGQSAEVSGDFQPSSQTLRVTIKAKSLNIAEMQAGSGHLLSAAAIPLLESFHKGRWTGFLQYQTEGGKPGIWAGAFDVREVQADVPGLRAPVQIASASVLLDGKRVEVKRLHGRVEKLQLDGDYRYEPGDDWQHHFHIAIPEADLADLERILLPTLRRERGFLARTLKLNSQSTPEWLASRQVNGNVRIGRLTAGDLEWTDVKTRVLWDGPEIQLQNIQAVTDEGTVKGSAVVELSGNEPKYRLRGQVKNLNWQGGTVDLSGTFNASGMATDFLQSLQGEGTFQARALSVLPETPITSVAGSYVFSVSRQGPKITLTSVQAALGAERFSGSGETQQDGQLQLELASASRTVHVTGPLTPLRLDLTTIKP
jgi:hypothetical protein